MGDMSATLKTEDTVLGLSPPASYRVIYVYSDTHPDHEGRVKVGDTTLHSRKRHDELTLQELEKVARKRIDSYTKTADIDYTLEHVELAVRGVRSTEGENTFESFRDYKVHDVLVRSGHKKVFARQDKSNGEWFDATVDQVRSAIQAVKNYSLYLEPDAKPVINLRPEQKDAVRRTIRCFQDASLDEPRRMLWNAKMRFGKTLTAFKVIERLTVEKNISKVLVVTHRPDVNSSWSEDFVKSGLSELGWTYGSKKNNVSWNEIEKHDRFLWFASIQDLRGSYKKDSITEADFQELVKNENLFETEFDLVVTDEAHEGTLTLLAKKMFRTLRSSRYLDLSGTPFNIVAAENWDDEELAERFSYDDRYHWSYPDERKAKKEWDENPSNEGKVNPYGNLPEIKFVTYDVSESLATFPFESKDDHGDIDFTELFRTRMNENDQYVFVHEEAVEDLLHKMQGSKRYSSDPALFPYHKDFSNYFNHTLWMLPNVAACHAMENLLESHHSGFAGFKVVNATGTGGDTWDSEKSALEAVRTAISQNANTITLSRQMLTTGVTVVPWTAVFMLNNTKSPMLYMQTAFRAASPGSLPDGREKETAYVFDFNPDRCLREIVEVAKANAPQDSKGDPVEQAKNDERTVEEYLNYISVLSLEGSKFVTPDSSRIMEQLNEAYINETIDKGFDSPRLWNNKQLQTFDIEKVAVLEALRRLQGGKANDDTKGVVEVSSLSEKERELLKKLSEKSETKDSGSLTEEESATKSELEKKSAEATKTERKNRKNAVSILAGVASKLPLMVYAAPPEVTITPENFAELIDEISWREFMPKNLVRVMPKGTKPLEDRKNEALGAEGNPLYWDDVRRFFDPVIFSLSCERLRRIARENASKPPLEAAFRTQVLFGTFRNPDKETVLTPARVVELQCTNTIGGLSFLDLEQSTPSTSYARMRNKSTGDYESVPVKRALALLDDESHELAPSWIEPGTDETKNLWESEDTTIFDINSKTALYPLYGAVSLYWKRCGGAEGLSRLSTAEQRAVWNSIVERQIFANCRVPYSALIARRVLAGYDDQVDVNTSVVDVVELRSKLKDVRLPKGKGKKGVRPMSIDEESMLWRSLLNPHTMRYGLVENLTKEVLMTDDESMQELLANLERTESVAVFDCVVSNPPYTEKSQGSSSTATSIYPDFMQLGLILGRLSSMITPARWMNSPKGELRSARESLRKKSQFFSKLFYVEDNVFGSVEIAGGVSFYLANSDHTGLTDFYVDGEYRSTKPLFDSSGTVTVDEIDEIRVAIWSIHDLIQPIRSNKVVTDWLHLNPSFAKEGLSNELYFKYSTDTKQDPSDVAMHMGKKGVQYFPSTVFPAKDFVPEGKFAFVFAHAANNNPEGMNDWSLFLKGRESAKPAHGFVFDTPEQIRNFYKYGRTKFFTCLVKARLGTHHASPQAYQDVPLFKFTDNDVIDWSKTVPEIDLQLIEHFGLEEHKDYILKIDKPYARAFATTELQKFAEYGIDVTGLNDWY